MNTNRPYTQRRRTSASIRKWKREYLMRKSFTMLVAFFLTFCSIIAVHSIVTNEPEVTEEVIPITDIVPIDYSASPDIIQIDRAYTFESISFITPISTTYEEISPQSSISIDPEPQLPPEDIIEEVIDEPEPEFPPEEDIVEDYSHDDFNEDSSVMCFSGLSAEQIEGMLDNYPGLDGLGEAIYNVEQENGVNAYYTLAVASLESGYGTTSLARNKNNLFGMINCTFKSRQSCVAYFGELMIDYRDNHDITMTPNGINPRYCTSDEWAYKVTELMNQWVHKANEMY